MPPCDRRAPARARRSTPDEQLQKKAHKMAGLALATLEGIMKGSGSDTAKFAAAREVLSRALGRQKLGGKDEGAEGMTVIVKRFSDVTPEDEAEADETEARY
jgi:hypothetical protein